MLQSVFEKPVKVVLGRQAGITSVVGPEQAAQCLTSGFWPDKSGVAFENAMSACLKSLSGACAPEMAREAFISAARRAHVLAEDEIAH